MDTVILRHAHILNEDRFERSNLTACAGCNKKYTLINRKHHCRVCGLTYCTNCAPKIAILEGADDDLIRCCQTCATKVMQEARAEAGLERQKQRKVKEVLKAKAEGVESKAALQEVDGTMASQLQQKMRMQEQVQKNVDEKSQAELVLEPLPDDWKTREYRIECVADDLWEADDTTTKCTSCAAEFTNQLRRHHCRGCGKIYCSPCVPFIGVPIDMVSVPLGDRENLRTCGACAQRSAARLKRAKAVKGEKKARVLAEIRAQEKVAPPESP